VHTGLDELLGEGLIAQIVALGVALAAGGAVYAGDRARPAAPEAHQILDLLRSRMGRRAS
jgi:hypothetical protein